MPSLHADLEEQHIQLKSVANLQLSELSKKETPQFGGNLKRKKRVVLNFF